MQENIFPMWPDWTGESVAIIASGPTAKKAKVSLLQSRMRVIAIKKSVELASFADVVYGCDGPWWRSVQGLPKFKGLKLAYEPTVCGSEWGIQKVDIKNPASDEMLFEKTGVIGSGGNSGFQALNLALQFGASRVLLVGFDMRGDSGAHWYGRNNWMQANNPTDGVYGRWVRAMNSAALKIKAQGVSVANASDISALECFPKMPIEAALDQWGLCLAA